MDALNEQLGTDRPVVTQYLDWAGGLAPGRPRYVAHDAAFRRGTCSRPRSRTRSSSRSIAFIICVPLSILGGVIAGLRYGRSTDKSITVAGISLAAMPEFVTGIVLILVFAIWLGWLPVTAQAEEGASLATQVKYLLLPALTLTLVLFGYIARITRAGVIEALESDYTRTAYLQGPPVVASSCAKHVLRNALPPTIAVVAVQVGYLVGGLVAVEVLFNYQGIGLLVYEAARGKDLPLLTAGVLVIGTVYLVVTLIADILYAALNPRIRLGRRRVSNAHDSTSSPRRRCARRGPRVASGCDCSSARRPCSSATVVLAFWVFCAIFPGIAPVQPDLRQPVPDEPPPEWGHPFGTDTNGRDIFSRVLAGSRSILRDRTRRRPCIGTVLGTSLGLITGYFRGVVDDVHRAVSSTPFSRFR